MHRDSSHSGWGGFCGAASGGDYEGDVLQRAEEIGATILRIDDVGSVEIANDDWKIG